MDFHKPVLLQQVIEFLCPQKDEWYIDATLGGGGHTFELLKRGAKVLALDRDTESIEYVKKRTQGQKNLVLEKSNFNKITEVAKKHGIEKVSGILFDLGVSSHQLGDAKRGFSFQKEGKLDMRMDTTLPISAYDIVNNFDKRRIYEILKTYGQEKFSRAIADAICRTRAIKPIETTNQLARIISEVYGNRKEKIHPATRTFQALRIIVNSELLNLEETLPQTVNLIRSGGRLVIISFHSLEDGIVKRFFKHTDEFKTLTDKPVGAEVREIEENPRSRSAKLRAAIRI